MVQLLAHWTGRMNVDWLWNFLNHINALMRFDPAFLTALPGIIWALLAWKVSTLVLTNRRIGTVLIRLVQTIGKLKIKDVEAEWPQRLAAQRSEIEEQRHQQSTADNEAETTPLEILSLPKCDDLVDLQKNKIDETVPTESAITNQASDVERTDVERALPSGTAHKSQAGSASRQEILATPEQALRLAAEVDRLTKAVDEITNNLTNQLAVYKAKTQTATHASNFLKIYAYLSAEQLTILRSLNAGAFPRQVLVQLHKRATPLQGFGQGSTGQDEVWIDYLISSNLIKEEFGQISLTSDGRDFLKFLVDQRLPLNKST